MEDDPQRMTEEEFGFEAVRFGDLPVTKERAAYLVTRLSELLRDLRKLELLDSTEIEPAMTPFFDPE